MSNRRQFLSTLAKSLGAGGLLLPSIGNGALALPLDLGEAARLPLVPAALPVSPEALRLREILAGLHAKYLRSRYVEHDPLDHAHWYLTKRDEYRPLAATIAARPNPTWQDVVEMAEVLWTSLPKQDRSVPVRGAPNEWCFETTGAICVEGDGTRFRGAAWQTSAIIAALVEAILTLGNGQRFDPQTTEGYFPQRVRPVAQEVRHG